MKVEAYLYDASGSDRAIDLAEDSLAALTDKQLLWVNVLEREASTLEQVAQILKLKNLPINSILKISERPKLDKFENFYRFFVVSVQYDDDGNLSLIPIDFIVGLNFVITVHTGKVGYYSEFIEDEKGETQIGELDAESFVVSLLDLHIVSYFRVLERIENRIDKMDERILKRDLQDEEFLNEIIKLRSDVSRLRRWLLPHRDVFYALARPDFKTTTTDSDSLATFQLLNEHFETCAAAIESSRDSVLSLFNLYATKTTHKMNVLIRRLTFITLVVGALGAIAGIWGMNFEVEYFKAAENGFWLTIAAMLTLTLGLTALGRWKRWI